MPMWTRWKTLIDSPWNDALTPGWCSSVSAHVRMTRSLTEIFGWPSSPFSSSRSSHARSMATSDVT